jgi:hypothetical protein
MLSYLSYFIRPGLILAFALAALPVGAGCAGTPKAPVKVIGVSDAHDRDATRMLLFFLEVRNPTGRQIQVSQLDYQLEAKPWFVAEGRVRVSRSITAGGSAVIQVPVRLDAKDGADSGVPYVFEGTLRVRSGGGNRHWRVRAKGELAAESGPDRSAYVVLPAAPTRE